MNRGNVGRFESARNLNKLDPELVLSFARAVAKPRGNALLLTPENKADRWVSMTEAVASRRPFAVDLDRPILAFDSDDPNQQEKARELGSLLAASDVRPVVISSGRPGHVHIFARVPDPAVRKHFGDLGRSSGLDCRRFIRPPLSPHRLGFIPRLLLPNDPQEALEALEPDAMPRGGRLSRRIWRLLRLGDVERRYESRSEVVQAIVLSAVNAGLPVTWLFEALANEENQGGAKVHEIAGRNGDAAARRYIERCWRSALKRARSHPSRSGSENAAQRIAEIEAIAEQRSWPGKAGGTDRAVLQAHLDIARLRGSLEYHAGVRCVAERAGVSARTAFVSQGRLRNGGWLEVAAPSRGTKATSWRMRPRPTIRANLQHSTAGGGVRNEC